ncbi:MAG: glycosyltransferase family 4 protein [Chlorobiaceae bacterium]|nr:glycosyltransferase family 4 protein [Chlorobiaceae bacterium]
MRLVLITDAFPPMRSSGAVQVRDLALEFARQGHEVSVVVPSPDSEIDFKVEAFHGVELLRIRVPQNKNISYVQRAVSEALMPVSVVRALFWHSSLNMEWDGVVCYAPSIFLGPIVKALKIANRCPSYLIIRDIFPQWALDMGLMSKGIPYHLLKMVEGYLYGASDVIGVQTAGNLHYFSEWLKRKKGRRLEVLQNWLAEAPDKGCSITVDRTALSGRKIFVYAGNMGRAQGMDIILDLADAFRNDASVGFLLVGRGSEADRLRVDAENRGLDNTLFFDEIEPEEIPGLYCQCHVGLVVLDPRHKTHNIPGKFLSYMQAGLPVLATINPGNDLVKLIETKRVGIACLEAEVSLLHQAAYSMLEMVRNEQELSTRCKALWHEQFSVEAVARQITLALDGLK